MKTISFVAFASCAILAGSAFSQQVIVVNTLEDLSDFAGARQVANLPGPDGLVSFREAVTAANNTPGPQTIEFAIPRSGFWLFTNMALLKVEQSPGGFQLTGNDTTIDFTSQTRNIGDTNPGGNEVGIYSLMSNFTLPQAGITLLGDNCIIKGLDTVRNFGYGIRILGNNNRIIGCHLFDPLGGGAVDASIAIRSDSSLAPTGNIIGGGNPGEGNTLACYPGSAIEITGPAADNIVIGNTLTTSHVSGILVQAGAVGTRIGGDLPGERNVIAGNGTGGGGIPQNQDVLLDGAVGTQIIGNYLGTSASGMNAAPAPAVGIVVRNCSSTTIADNVISGYFTEGVHQGRNFRTGTGIILTTLPGGHTDSTIIQGNRIGVASDGVSPLANAVGIDISTFDPMWIGTLIGGEVPGQGNIIAHNQAGGVFVHSGNTGVRISGNSILANGEPDSLFPVRGLGIDLVGPSGIGGITQNDPGDDDTGGNGLQNFPVLTSARRIDTHLQLAGSLPSSPFGSFSIEFFANVACDPSGYGQGARFLGAVASAADGSGTAAFVATLAADVAIDETVTATATDVFTGNTSEFSSCLPVTAGCAADFNADGTVDFFDYLDFVNAFAQGC